MEDIKNENQTKENFGTKVKNFFGKAKDKTMVFIVENPQLTLPLLSGIGMLFGGGVKLAMNARKNRLKDCEFEDDFTGGTYRTSHPLTNDEILELERQMNGGKSKGEALNDMGVLRKEKRRK